MISLTPLKLAHSFVLARASKDPQFLAGLRYPGEMKKAAAREEARLTIKKGKPVFTIVLEEIYRKVLIGRIGISEREGKTYIFYWIIPHYQGQGYGSEAVKKFLLLCNIRPLYAEVKIWNAPSRAILEAQNFMLLEENNEYAQYCLI